MTDDPLVTFLVVCTGITEVADGKLGMILQVIENFNIIPEHHVFAQNSCRKAGIFVGGMYNVEATADFKTAKIANAKYTGRWNREEDLLRWKADERALEISRTAMKKQKEDSQRNAMIEALRPLREKWIETNNLGRLALEVQVLAYLRGTRVS